MSSFQAVVARASCAMLVLVLVACACVVEPSSPTDARTASARKSERRVQSVDGPHPLDTLALDAARGICGALVRCCDGVGVEQYFGSLVADPRLQHFAQRVPPHSRLTEADCGLVVAELLTTAPLGDWVEAVRDGAVEFVPDAARACSDRIATAACGRELVEALHDPSCFGVSSPGALGARRAMFRRTRAPGDACRPVRDGLEGLLHGTCDSQRAFCCYREANDPAGHCRLPAEGRAGTCVATSDVDESCNDASAPLKLCARGHECDARSGACREAPAAALSLGDACVGSDLVSLGECRGGWCDALGSKRCTALAAAGGRCTAGVECASGYCAGGRCDEWTLCVGDLAAIVVAVAPSSVTVEAGRSIRFEAGLSGRDDARVRWSVREPDGGSITPDGTYTAPAHAGTFHVVATSGAASTRSAEASVTVVPPSVVVEPRTALVPAGGDRAFTALLEGVPGRGVRWSVEEPDGGSIDAKGRYRAPAKSGEYHVVATSVRDATRSARATIWVPPVTVTIAPSAISLLPRASRALAAHVAGAADGGVTWTVEGEGGGAVDADGLYTAPLVDGTFTVRARSRVDPHATATATVTVSSVAVTVDAPAAKLAPGATGAFTATVEGAARGDVVWTLADASGGTITQGGVYTAPVVPGTYRVTASSVEAPGAQAEAIVVVAPPEPLSAAPPARAR